MLAYLRKGETQADLAGGFGFCVATVFRCIREALDVLAALASTLDEAVEIARREAFVIVDGTLLRIDRVGMTGGQDRPFCSGKHKRHGIRRADPRRSGQKVDLDLARAAGCTARHGL